MGITPIYGSFGQKYCDCQTQFQNCQGPNIHLCVQSVSSELTAGVLLRLKQDTVRRIESSILALMIIFQVKINVAMYILSGNGVQIFKKWVLGMSIFTQKLTRPP